MDQSGGDRVRVPEGPVRTCIGCRERGPSSQMVRIVASRHVVLDAPATGGEQAVRVVVDVRHVLPGRGAWLHATCVELALRRRAVSRSLRVAGELDTTALRSWIADQAGAGAPDRREGSGLEADGHPMSTQR